jgi:formylglycine-generating enzyme required for sulfatase activity
MVGNLAEWVEDWMQDNEDIDGGTTSVALDGNATIFGIDEAFTVTDRFPAALLREATSWAPGPRRMVSSGSMPVLNSETSSAFGFRRAQ